MNAAAEQAAIDEVFHRRLCAHEAGHAAMALLLGLDVERVTVSRTDLSREPADPDAPAGYVEIRRNGDPDYERKRALTILGGPLEDTVDWPPRWPLSLAQTTDDEAQLGGLVKQLDLDAAGYRALVREALGHAATPEYGRLHFAMSALLEQHPDLDAATVRRVKAIANGVDVEHKTMGAATVATGQEAGTFEAIVSAWEADRERDVIAPTAFDKTIAAWRASGKNLPLLFEHSTEAVGHVDPASMRPTEDGLRVAGEVDRSTEKGRQAWRQIKAGSAGFSIGFMAKSRPRKGGGRELTEIDLLEISFTSTPIHPAARALSWKSAATADNTPSHVELEQRLVAAGVIPSRDPAFDDVRRKARALILEQLTDNALDHKSTGPVTIATFDVA